MASKTQGWAYVVAGVVGGAETDLRGHGVIQFACRSAERALAGGGYDAVRVYEVDPEDGGRELRYETPGV